MAHISGDPACCAPSPKGWTCTAPPPAEVFGVPVDEVSSEQRRYAKVINFGLIYGMGAFGLARSPVIEQQAAKTYIERYFQRYRRREALHGRDQGAASRATSRPCSARR